MILVPFFSSGISDSRIWIVLSNHSSNTLSTNLVSLGLSFGISNEIMSKFEVFPENGCLLNWVDVGNVYDLVFCSWF